MKGMAKGTSIFVDIIAIFIFAIFALFFFFLFKFGGYDPLKDGNQGKFLQQSLDENDAQMHLQALLNSHVKEGLRTEPFASKITRVIETQDRVLAEQTQREITNHFARYYDKFFVEIEGWPKGLETSKCCLDGTARGTSATVYLPLSTGTASKVTLTSNTRSTGTSGGAG